MLPRNEQRLADILIKAKLIDDLQIKSASARLGFWGKHLPHVLAEGGFAEEDVLTEAIGRALSLPVNHLAMNQRDKEALAKLDAAFCEQYAVFPIGFKGQALTVAMVDPTDVGTVEAVKTRAGMRIHAVLVSEIEIINAILKHYRNQEPRPKKEARRTAPNGEFELDMAKPPDPRGEGHPGPSGAEPLLPASGIAFSKQDLERLEVAQLNQQKASTILRAVRQLLEEKGMLKR